MNDEEIKATIFKVLKNIAPETDPEKLDGDENFREALDIDSFDFLQLVVGLDEKFGINTPETDYGKISTLNSMLTYIKRTIKVKA